MTPSLSPMRPMFAQVDRLDIDPAQGDEAGVVANVLMPPTAIWPRVSESDCAGELRLICPDTGNGARCDAPWFAVCPRERRQPGRQ
jgi:hypothetical protein